MIQLVCFDLGRVLIRICDSWRHACDIASVTTTLANVEDSAQALAAMDEVIGRYDTGRIDLEGFAREIAPLRGLTPEDVIRLNHCFLRGPYEGTAELIDALNAAGVSTACLSNTAEPHWSMMHDRAGGNYLPMERLTYRFASHLIGHRKPHDAIYEHVERVTGMAPASILFFDDLQANVAAAIKRGWLAHQIRTETDPIAQVREHVRGHGVRLSDPR